VEVEGETLFVCHSCWEWLTHANEDKEICPHGHAWDDCPDCRH
jgi:hypothetical protein